MKWLSDLTSSQWWAASRQYISFAAGIAAAVGVLTATQQTQIMADVDQVISGLKQVIAGLAGLAAILVPIVSGIIASRKASPASNIKTVQAIAADPAQPQSAEAKVALVEATNSMSEVRGVVMTRTGAGAALALSIPSSTVATAGTPDAKAIAAA